ncbi:MAG: sugar phosphate nucleotidyltransferase [Candidatus Eisenbacteria bacterium]
MAKDLVILLAGGAGSRLLLLSEHRAKPAVPFGGIYRIVDFALSNCVNSGLYQILVLTQYRPWSLMKHLDFGNPWHLNRLDGGMVMRQPFVGSVGSSWYQGNADAVRQNLHFIEERSPEAVLILAGDHVYKMDYRPLLDFHKERNADLTVAVKQVRSEDTDQFGTCVLADDKRVVHFEEKSKNPRSDLASMGIYVFNRQTLFESLLPDSRNSESPHDFGHDIVPSLIRRTRVYGYEFQGYWQDVGTVGTYFESNMALLQPDPPVDLSDPGWPVLTKFEDLPPARILRPSVVSGSMICDGCTIAGTVESSIVSPGVIVEEDAVVRNSIVLPGCRISSGSRLNLTIIDRDTLVGESAKIGMGIDFTPNEEHPDILDKGITLVGKGSYIPPGSTIGRNCLVRTTKDAGPLKIASGKTVAEPVSA